MFRKQGPFPLKNHISSYHIFSVKPPGWMRLNMIMTTINRRYGINQHHDMIGATNPYEEAHLSLSWEQDVLCAIMLNLTTCLIRIPHLACWSVDRTSVFLTSNWVKDHAFTKLVWYFTLSNNFDPIRLITLRPDRRITNIGLCVFMRLFFLSHDSTANPTMTNTCRQEASSCTVDAIVTALPLWQTLPQILLPKYFY